MNLRAAKHAGARPHVQGATSDGGGGNLLGACDQAGEGWGGAGLTLALRSSCWNSGCGKRPWFFTKAGTSGGRRLS